MLRVDYHMYLRDREHPEAAAMNRQGLEVGERELGPDGRPQTERHGPYDSDGGHKYREDGITKRRACQ